MPVDKELEDLQGYTWDDEPEGTPLDFPTWGNKPRTCEWMITNGYCCTDFIDEELTRCECWDDPKIREVMMIRRGRFNYGYRRR